jgi:hypothetical protein
MGFYIPHAVIALKTTIIDGAGVHVFSRDGFRKWHNLSKPPCLALKKYLFLQMRVTAWGFIDCALRCRILVHRSLLRHFLLLMQKDSACHRLFVHRRLQAVADSNSRAANPIDL